MITSRRALGLFCVLLASACPSGDQTRPGLAVAVAEPSGAGAEAGLRSGDRLLAYRRQAAPPANPQPQVGGLASCAELAEIEVEQAPRGPVRLEIERGGHRLALDLPAGEWRIAIASSSGDAACSPLAAALHARDGHEPKLEAEAWARAARWAETARRPLFLALALEREGSLLVDRNDFAAAEQRLQRALHLRQGAAPGSLGEASAWHQLGRLERVRGANDKALAYLQKANALRSRLAPDSLERAFTLNNLGIVASARGDQKEAGALYSQALAVVHRRRPDGIDEASVLNNLGLMHRRLGDLALAEGYFRSSYRINLQLNPNGLDTANSLTNLGAVAYDRGNFALSESYNRESIERHQIAAPSGLGVANGLYNLGLIAAMRQDDQGAMSLFQQSLEIRHRLAPDSMMEADTISALGDNAVARGRLDEAQRLGEQAFALRSRLAPDSEETAISLGILARVALNRLDFDRARELASRELALHRAHHASAQRQAHSHHLLAEVAFRRGDWEEAGREYRAAVDLQQIFQLHSINTADSLDGLGQVELKLHHERRAEAIFREALDALEGQLGELGGTDEQLSTFEARYLPFYFDLIDLQLARGDRAGALHTLERSRARGLLSLLAQRDLTFTADLPAPLRARQRAIDGQYAGIQREIAALDPQRRREIAILRTELEQLASQRAALAAEIARTSPRYAALSNPRPLELAGIQSALDPGTVYLSYSLGETKSYLFIVTPKALRVAPLAASRETIGREVGIFRSLLLTSADDPSSDGALRAQSRRLYDLLLAPAEREVQAAERIVLSPDGALHTLPFAALLRPGPGAGRDGGYLIEGKPIHTVISATLYAELKARRRTQPQTERLAAFADPSFPRPPAARDAGTEGAEAGPEDSPLRRYHLGLPPLPAARDEARSLSSLYGAEAQIFLGAAASERQATHLAGNVSILHFASHALLDRHFPLDSALALAAPASASLDGTDDGLLQAWEIFERLRLEADLVTLSACETGLGASGGGEGLIGLTRAFQYAGARSILASLWSVSDRSTSELMKRFYAALRAGLPKDRALQQAQIELLRSGAGRLSHPYSWAGFEMIGDWR